MTADIAIPTASGDFGRIDGLAVKADVRDALGKLAVKAGIDLGGFSQPGLDVASARVDLDGDARLFKLSAKANGRQAGDEFDITTDARLDVLGPRQEIFLDRLTGRAAGQNIDLKSPAKLVLDKGVMQIDKLDLVVGEARIQGGANMGDGKLGGRFDLGPLPLSMLAQFGAPPLTGTAKGDIRLAGTPTAPKIDVALDIAEIRPGDSFYRNKPGFDADIRTAIGGGRLKLDVDLAGLAAEPGRISLSMPLGLSLEPFALDLSDTARLDGTVKAKADIGKLSVLAPLDGQRIAGVADLDLVIRGTLARPLVEGDIVLDDGVVQDAASGFTLADTTMRLEVKNQRIEIVKLEATDSDKGRISLDGSIGIDPNSAFPFDITITSKEMRVLESTLGRAFVSTDLALKGDSRGGRVAGKVTLDSANIQIPGGGGIDPVKLDVVEVGASSGKTKPTPKKPAPKGPGFDLALDIDFVAPSRLFVRGRGLESEWGGELDITGKAASPEIAGAIEFRRGYLDFLDRRFAIRTGKIGFTGDLIPEIELSAAAQGEELVAIVGISGPATKPEFELTSEPSRPQDEILSDLLFKRDVSSITPAQGVRLAAAIRTLEGGGTDTLGQLRDSVGLDTLDIGGESAGEATAKAGKYIADGVFLEVERGLASGSGKARVEIELTDNITVNTEVTEDAQSGVGIEWRLDY
ncbi:MAG: translocation/assembly module TamB domain-containing protein [Geminicoccaceae bacterium]